MKRQTTITIMRIIEVITEAASHTVVNKVAENPKEDPNRGEGDSKTITGANTKATADNLTPSIETITIIIIMVIMKAEVGHGCGGNNYRGHGHRLGNYRGHNNYQYYQYYTHDDGSQVE